jgi:hypothetical protein
MEPTGLVNPLRVISTPVMNVVETAPQPTMRIPSFPSAGFTFVLPISLISFDFVSLI